MFESLAGKLEDRRGVERPLKNACQRDKDIGKKISCFYINARSLRNKFLELQSYVSLENPDIIFITETWVKFSVQDNKFNQRDSLSEYDLQGYILFHYERKGTEGGGVFVYVNEVLKPNEMIGVKEDNNIESVWVEIICKNDKRIKLGNFYRPPGINIQNELEASLFQEIRNVVDGNNLVVIVGDFNYADINWNDRTYTYPTSGKFIEFCEDIFLNQYVEGSTRGENTLDLIFSNQEIIENLRVGENFGFSDHQIIRFDLKLESKTHINNAMVPDFRRANWEGFLGKMNGLNWEYLFHGKTTYEMWDIFKTLLDNFTKQFIPMRRIRKNKKVKPKWMNGEIKRLIKETRKAYQIQKSNSSEENQQRFRQLLHTKKGEIRKSKRLCEIELANNIKDSKQFFKYFSNNKKQKSSIGPLLEEGNIISTDIEIADILNNHFGSVFTTENLNNIPDFNLSHNKKIESPMALIRITERVIRKGITNLKVSKSPGPDEISPKILKMSIDSTSKALNLIFNRSVMYGEVPTDWKSANVVPIFKKGSQSDKNNYRPVSLTSIVGKLLESIIRERLQKFLEENKLINSSQHGFTKGKSCLTNLIEFFERVFEWYDQGDSLDIIYLDFSKAFDKVPHKRLIKKLEGYGIQEDVLRWIAEWLGDRKQRVQLNGHRSGWMEVRSGVPQGSVLGPLLFTIFIDDIDEQVLCEISKFADDTKIASQVNTLNDIRLLQRSLDKLVAWANKWEMRFNVNKCGVMHIGKRNLEYQYQMSDGWVKSIDEERDLGVVISKDLKFSRQCLMAKNKANSMLGIINRGVSYKASEVISKLYRSYVRPHLEYCIQFWKPINVKDADMLEGVQRRATKMIPSLRNLSYEERLKRLGMFSLRRRRIRGDMIEVFKMIHGIDKVNLGKLFIMDEDRRTRGHDFCLKIKRHVNSNIGLNFFTRRVINYWNQLSDVVVDCKSLDTFKVKLDEFMTARGEI